MCFAAGQVAAQNAAMQAAAWNTQACPTYSVLQCRYSWGACLATHALSCPRVTGYVGISFPLGGLAMVLQPRKNFTALCAATHVPRLLVAGTQVSHWRMDNCVQSLGMPPPDAAQTAAPSLALPQGARGYGAPGIGVPLVTGQQPFTMPDPGVAS
jgi:hypothetical protein